MTDTDEPVCGVCGLPVELDLAHWDDATPLHPHCCPDCKETYPEPPECDGRCIHASDLGLPHNVMAYPDPECSLHGTWGQLGDPVASPEDAT